MRSRRPLRAVLLAVASATTLAACGSGAGQAASNYPTARALIRAMTGAGAPCSKISYHQADASAGRGLLADCSATSAGDTVVSVFATRAAAQKRANFVTSPSYESVVTRYGGPVAAVVVGNGLVSTSPKYARRVAAALGGQLLPPSSGSAPAVSAPAPTASADPTAAECSQFSAVFGDITRSTSGETWDQLTATMNGKEDGWASRLSAISGQYTSESGQAGDIALDMAFLPVELLLVKQEGALGPTAQLQAEAEWTRTQADLGKVSGDCDAVS